MSNKGRDGFRPGGDDMSKAPRTTFHRAGPALTAPPSPRHGPPSHGYRYLHPEKKFAEPTPKPAKKPPKHPPPTLIDRLYRTSFQNEPVAGWLYNAAMRDRFVRARRFVLDERMSAFLGDLANVTYTKAASVKLRCALAENTRVSARLPHPVTWVEYDLHAEMRRAAEVTEGDVLPAEDTPKREGWLLEQHPSLDYAFRLHLFSDMAGLPFADESGYDAWTFPVCYGWTVNDQPLPWRAISQGGEHGTPSEVFTGLHGYRNDRLNIVVSDLIPDVSRYDERHRGMVKEIVAQWTGVIRRVWAFLATINDIPILATEVKQSHGFLGRGQIRKYLTHHTLTLNIPQKTDTRKLARRVVAFARRRGHEVRGHWRNDWRQPGVSACQHLFAEDQRCTHCGKHRIWIAEYHRGDDTLGRVIHDYAVKHEVTP